MEGGNLGEIRRGAAVCGPESGHRQGGVEVLADLGNYPISDGPGVNPGDVAGLIAAFYEDGGSKGGD